MDMSYPLKLFLSILDLKSYRNSDLFFLGGVVHVYFILDANVSQDAFFFFLKSFT